MKSKNWDRGTDRRVLLPPFAAAGGRASLVIPPHQPPARHVLAVVAALCFLLPGASQAALAELEVLEYSRTSPGAPATQGYFYRNHPALVSESEDITPVGDGTGDVLAEYVYLYQDGERVNSERNRGPGVLGPLGPRHSYAKASGYADAGANTLGGYTNLGAFAYVVAGDEGSTAAAYTQAKIEFTFTVDAGESGAVAGDPVAGLRWEFATDGTLSVWGTTHPQVSASAAAANFHGMILRGPTGFCGPFDCPHGAYAASVDLQTAVSLRSRIPDAPGTPTGQVIRDSTWTARNNSTLFGGGTQIAHGGEYNVMLALADGEDDPLGAVVGFHTGGAPLNVDHIDFNATVGETLKLTADLTVAASLAGVGGADADLFGSFATRIFDPLGRGYDVHFMVAPIPVPAGAWLFGSGLLGLAGVACPRPKPQDTAKFRLTKTVLPDQEVQHFHG